jgi:hypothetical protein
MSPAEYELGDRLSTPSSAAAVKISEDRVPGAILVDREYDARVIDPACARRRALQDQQLIT